MRDTSVAGWGAPASEAPPDAALAEPVAAAAEVLSARPAGLVTDLDGTLSPIVPTPEEAFILPDCRVALRRLVRHLDLVAIVSGRSADEVRRMVGLRRLIYVGNHGLDRWEGGRRRGRVAARPWRAALSAVMKDLHRELAGVPGIRVEDKGISLSVHYRNAPNHGAAHAVVVAAVERCTAPYRLSVREAKKVIEIGPPTWPGKADAVLELAERFGLRSVIYMGDDQPDLEVFRRLPELSSAGVRTLAIAVDSPEAPPELKKEADVRLADPDEVARFLSGLGETLRAANDGRSSKELLSSAV